MAVKIAIEGLVEREVMHLSYSIHQEVDVEGRPTAISRGGQLNVTVKSLGTYVPGDRITTSTNSPTSELALS